MNTLSFLANRELTVLPTLTAVRAVRQRRLEAEGLILGQPETALGRLMSAFLEAAGVPPALGEAGLAEVAAGAAASLPDLAQMAHPAAARALARVWERFSAAGPDPETTVSKIIDLDRPRLAGLARGFAVYRAELARRSLEDPQARAWRAGQAARQGVRPDLLAGVERIVVREIEAFSPAQVDFLAGLAESGLAVEIHLPFCPGPAKWGENWAQFRAFEEALGDRSVPLDLLPEDVAEAGPERVKPLLSALAGRPAGQVVPADFEFMEAPGRYAEVEAVARQVRQLLEEGISPDRISLVFRSLAGLTGQMVADVAERFTLPLEMRRGQPLAETGLVRAILSGLTLALEGPERDNLLRVAESGYYSDLVAAGLRPGGLATAILGSGLLPGQTEVWANLLPPEAVQRLQPLLEALAAFGRPLRLDQGLDELRHLLDRLRLRPAGDRLGQRDQLSLAEVSAALEDLESDFRRLGKLEVTMSPERFKGLVERTLAGRDVAWGRQEAGGIKVLRLEDLMGLEVDHLFLVGLVEGEWPPALGTDSLLSDPDKFLLNKALSHGLFRTAAEHYGREKLLFLRALARAGKKIHFSRHLADSQGRPSISSSLWFWLERIMPVEPKPAGEFKTPPGRPPVLARDELVDDLSQTLFGPAGPPSAQDLALFQVLSRRPGFGQRLSSIARRAGLERQREDYLLHPDREAAEALAGPFVGRLADPAVKQDLWTSLHAQNGLRLRIRELEAYAACPFRFLAGRVWGLAPAEFPGPAPGAVEAGAMVHALLKAWHEKELAAGLWPPSLAGLDEVLPQAAAEWLTGRFRGHPGLIQALVREFHDLAPLLVAWEGEQAGQGWRPGEFEKKLSPVVIPLAGGDYLQVPARADRIDAQAQGRRFRLIDYKNSRTQGFYQALIREACHSSFQLPIYAESLNRDRAGAEVEAFYFLVRRAEATRSLVWNEELAEVLCQRIIQITADIEAGVFDVSPQDPAACAECGLIPLCRFQASLEGGEGGE